MHILRVTHKAKTEIAGQKPIAAATGVRAVVPLNRAALTGGDRAHQHSPLNG